MRQSIWIERNLTADGRRLNFLWRPWWILPLDQHHIRIGNEYRRSSVILSGRQTEKSTSLGNQILAECAQPNTKCLYVAPTGDKLSEFSFARLDQIVDDSPAISVLKNPRSWNVKRKAFLNRSVINLRSSGQAARVLRARDPARGIAADAIFMDEGQEMQTDQIPIIRECASHCMRPGGYIFRILGNPLTTDGPLEYYWAQQSTQNEWMVKCEGCGRWSDALGIDNMGPNGLICRHCKHPLNPLGRLDRRTGQREGASWIRTGPKTAPIEGFHIPQLLVPYSFLAIPDLFKQKWEEILYKLETYPRYMFFNEVLGISYDTGIKPITPEELRKCCSGTPRLTPDDLSALSKYKNRPIFVGIDWGTGSPSNTFLTAAAYDKDGVYNVFLMVNFTGHRADPETCFEEIFGILEYLNPLTIGLDWGMGFGINSRIRDKFGAGRVFQYMHTDQRAPLEFDDGANVFTTNRTSVLGYVFKVIKRGQAPGGIRIHATWEEMKESLYDQHFLSTFKETTRTGRMHYNHRSGTLDDGLHSLCFNLLGSLVKRPRRDLD